MLADLDAAGTVSTDGVSPHSMAQFLKKALKDHLEPLVPADAQKLLATAFAETDDPDSRVCFVRYNEV